MFGIWSTAPCRASYYGNSLLSFIEVWEVMNLLGFLLIPSRRKFGKCRYVDMLGFLVKLLLTFPFVFLHAAPGFLLAPRLSSIVNGSLNPFATLETVELQIFSIFSKARWDSFEFSMSAYIFFTLPHLTPFYLERNKPHNQAQLTGCKQYTSKINCVKFTTKMRKKLQLVVGVPIILCSPFMGH